MGGNSVANPMGRNFLGTGGTPINKPLSFISPLNPGFLGGGMAGRVGRDAATMGLGEFTQSNPFGVPGNPIAGVFGNGTSQGNSSVPGPFSLDPAQFAGDQAAINGLGTQQSGDINALADKQYGETIGQIPTTVSNMIQQENPSIMEGLNAGHRLDSSAYPQEIARQQSYLTQNLAMPAIQARQQMQQGALGTKQGFQTGATQRGLSLEDFINQANVAKTIGAQMAPPPPSSKANAGATMQGIGAMAPLLGK